MADDTNKTDVEEPEAELEQDMPPNEADPVDPELMQLPRRRRKRRHPLIAVVVIGLGLYLLWYLRGDLLYYFQPNKAVDLGDVATAVKQGKLRHNTHVTLQGAPDRKHALILESNAGYDSFFRLLQSDNRVFVQRHRELRTTDQEVTTTHTGRLVRFKSLPYADNLQQYFDKSMTVAHDLPFDQVRKARAAGQDRVTIRDVRDRPVRLTPESVIWINVAFPNEWVVQFRKQFYPKAEAAAQRVQDLKLPFARDSEESDMYWRFVVYAEPDEVPLLMARFRERSLNAGVVRRQLAYSARWNQLKVSKYTREIHAADPTFPARFAKQPQGEDEVARLVPVRVQPVKIPKASILFMETSSPLTVGDDAMVLIAGEKPSDNWFYLLLYIVLGAFVLVNVVSLVLRLRDRGSSAG